MAGTTEYIHATSELNKYNYLVIKLSTLHLNELRRTSKQCVPLKMSFSNKFIYMATNYFYIAINSNFFQHNIWYVKKWIYIYTIRSYVLSASPFRLTHFLIYSRIIQWRTCQCVTHLKYGYWFFFWLCFIAGNKIDKIQYLYKVRLSSFICILQIFICRPHKSFA